MNCLQNLPKSAPLNFVHKNSSSNYSSISRSSAPFMGRSLKSHSRRPPVLNLGMVRADRRGILSMNASSSSSSAEKGSVEVQVKSDVYSNNMTEAMGAVLTYRHELGMNYNFIRPDLIVGSCLQTQSDVDKLRKIGVKTIFCLQQDSDLEYFDVDICAIQDYTKVYKDVEHIRAEIRDFDAFDLRMRLPAVVSILHKAINRNGGVTYIHCTAGLGRAPATALAYMFWVQGYKLSEAHKLLQTKRPCFPKLDAIKNATADIGILWHMAACVISFCFGGVILVNGKPLNLTGLSKNRVQLMWNGGNFSSVEVSGLDIGWGQRIPLRFDEEQGSWILERDLPDGRYEYKYVVDGEWTCNKHESITEPNSDGHVNNYVQVHNISSDADTKELQKRLTGEEVDLRKEERQKIREFLDAYNE